MNFAVSMEPFGGNPPEGTRFSWFPMRRLLRYLVPSAWNRDEGPDHMELYSPDTAAHWDERDWCLVGDEPPVTPGSYMLAVWFGGDHIYYEIIDSLTDAPPKVTVYTSSVRVWDQGMQVDVVVE